MRDIAKAALPSDDGDGKKSKADKKSKKADAPTGDGESAGKKERQPLWRRKKEK